MQDLIKDLKIKNSSKIVLCVLDGLGGLPQDGKTELEYANTPNLDSLAKISSCGLHIPVARGITPGSGAAHLGLFGYDPLKFEIGRGVLEALGVGIQLDKKDIAIRGNFATVEYRNGKPIIVDRRAGRIATEENKRIVSKISNLISEIGGIKVNLYSGLEHRFVVVFTFEKQLNEGEDLIADTDPQQINKPPIEPRAKNNKSKKVASIVNKFVKRTAEILKDEKNANYMLLRGFSIYPNLPTYEDIYGLRAACIASYPMYRGVSRLVGMEILEVEDLSIKSEIDALKRHYDKFDFFYLHFKKTDSYGEDGNFSAKARVIEEFDTFVPNIRELNPDVLIITGDHSTPAVMKSHSWHPVPIMINSRLCRISDLKGFFESECNNGDLGIIKSTDIMVLAMAHANRLNKYGA